MVGGNRTLVTVTAAAEQGDSEELGFHETAAAHGGATHSVVYMGATEDYEEHHSPLESIVETSGVF